MSCILFSHKIHLVSVVTSIIRVELCHAQVKQLTGLSVTVTVFFHVPRCVTAVTGSCISM